MRWAAHTAHKGNLEKLTEYCSEDLKRRAHFGNLNVDQKIILNWAVENEFTDHRMVSVAVFYEYGDLG
jgi:hypothetical protein